MVRQAGLSSLPSRVTVNVDWVLNPDGNPAHELDEVWRKLAALQTVQPTTELVLTRIPLHRADVSALALALGTWTELTRLDLSDTDLFVEPYGAIYYIVDHLLQTRLTHLSLARTEMRDVEAVRLAAWLRESGASLVHLDLRDNGHHGGFNYETVRALEEAWNGPPDGLLVEYRTLYDTNEAGPRLRMAYADDEIGPVDSCRRANRPVYSWAIERLINLNRSRDRYRGDRSSWEAALDLDEAHGNGGASDEEAGVDPDTRHGNDGATDEEAGVDPDARHGDGGARSGGWSVVAPRNTHKGGRRVTPAVVTPAAGAATRARAHDGPVRSSRDRGRRGDYYYNRSRDYHPRKDWWYDDWDYDSDDDSGDDLVLDVSSDSGSNDDWSGTQKAYSATPRAG
jgi:hypothetical protein